MVILELPKGCGFLKTTIFTIIITFTKKCDILFYTGVNLLDGLRHSNRKGLLITYYNVLVRTYFLYSFHVPSGV